MINPKGKRKSSYIQSRDINGNIIYLDPITGKEVSRGVEQGTTLQASYPIKKLLMINLDVQKKHNERIKSGQSVMIRGKEVRITPKQAQVYLSTDGRPLSMKDTSKLSYELDYKLLQLDKAVNLTTTALGNFSNYFLPSTYAGALVDKLEGKNSFLGSLIEGNNGLGSVGTNLVFDLASPLVLGKGFSLMTTLGKEAKPILNKVSNIAKPLTNKINWLYNDGNIFNAPMRYNPNNFYRGVGKEALKDAKESGVIRGKYFKNPYFGKGKDWWNDGVVYEGSPERTAWIDAYPYDEEGKVIPFSNQFPFNALPYENGSTIVPTKSFSYWRKYPLLGWRKNSFRNVKTPTITAENAASMTPEQWTAAQDAAIARGDMAEAQRLADLHSDMAAEKLGFDVYDTYHGQAFKDETYRSKGYNPYSDARTRSGYYSVPSIDVARTYNQETGAPVFALHTYLKKPFIIDAKGNSWQQVPMYNLKGEVFRTTTTDKLANQAFGHGLDGVIVKNVDDIANGSDLSRSLAITDDYISTAGRNKLRNAVTYDNSGKRIGLGDRHNFNINDIRYSWLPWFLGGTSAAILYPSTGLNYYKDGGNLSKKNLQKAHGGKMNTLQFLKNGSGIHIKKENKGKFTDYCGGKVTSECISKGKHSSNPAIRKRATFAANARKWKHKDGGEVLKALVGTKMTPALLLAKGWGDILKLPGQLKDAAVDLTKLAIKKITPKTPSIYKNDFSGAGSGGRWDKAYRPKNISSFNDAFDEAVSVGADVFWFGDKLYNTLKEANPVREQNNRYVGKGRTEEVVKSRKGYGKDYGPIQTKLAGEQYAIKYKKGGKAFVTGVNILDSNPDAYKYVKKKIKKAADGSLLTIGLKIGNAINSPLGKLGIDVGLKLIGGILDTTNKIKYNEYLLNWKKNYINSQSLSDAERQKFYAQSVYNQQMNNPDSNVSDIVASHDAWKLEQLELQKRKKAAEMLANLYITQMNLIDNNNLTGSNGFNFAGMATDILSGVLGNSSKTQAVTNPSTTYSLFKMTPVDFTVNMKL